MSGDRNLPAGGLPPADLGKLYDVAPSRRDRLRSILPSSTDPVVPAERPERNQPVPDPAPEAGQDPKAGHPEPDQPVVAPVPPAVAPADDVVPVPEVAGGSRTKPVILYMPLQLRTRLRRAAVGSTQLNVMLDAVEKTESAGILGRLVREHQAPDTSGLFERQTPRGSEPQVQVNVRARPQHIAVLDQLAARYSSNRSELVRVALDYVLPGGPRRGR
ncbi:hypothetical protein ABZS29_38400 [Kribbella sp. NPDC005582]|uniref:hypothetical protein n=1 Tax=Kribbella sp. NPDC005582 TaxID=3156893 RepID=UPI0033A2BC3D